jgi:integrase
MGKRANGEGSIFRMPNGKWRVQVQFPSLPGRPLRRRIRHVATRAEASAMLDRLRQEAGRASPERMDVTGLLTAWIARGTHWAPSTIAQRDSAFTNHIRPHLGTTELSQLTPLAVDRWLQALTCGPRMKQLSYDVLRMACDYAADMELVHRNPCLKIDRPHCERKPIRPFTAQEVERIILGLAGSPWRAFAILCLTCGARQGELFGLKWGRVDIKNRKVFICEQATSTSGRVHVRKPKTKASTRNIDVTPAAAAALLDQKAARLAAGKASDDDLVFPAPKGGYMDRDRFRTRVWKPLLKKLGIDHRGAHHQRHTFATLALGAGIPPHVVSAVLGHSKVSTTLDLYAHAIPSQVSEAVAVLQRLFG